MLKVFWGIFFLLCSSLLTEAQYVDSGQDPSGVAWKEIKSDNFQILFPEAFQARAMRLAAALEKAYEAASITLDHKPKSITVVLHTYNSNANANVLWAPSRSNFNTIPPQDIYSQDWLDQLAIHEFRHVVQIDKMDQGMTRLLYYIFGQQATAAVFGLYIPFWFVEGDAVIAETVLSESGRGRLPSFTMPLRTQLMTKGSYSYEKAYLGSYKDFVPSYYNLGYYLTGMGRWRYGASIWEEALEKSARRPYIPTVFNNAVKKNAGVGKRRLYQWTTRVLDSIWREQDQLVNPEPYTAVNAVNHRFFTSYQFPVSRNGYVIALKSGYDQIDEFISVDSNGREQRLFYPGLVQKNRFSYNEVADKMIWSEYVLDRRWSNRIYSDLFIYDLGENTRKRLTSERYLFVPAISPDGQRVVAIEATPDYQFYLAFLDIRAGNVYERIMLDGNPFLLTPQWVDDDRVVFISLDETGKKMRILNSRSGEVKMLLNAGTDDITNPVAYKNYILFHGVWSGIDNIYAIDTLSLEVFKITDSKFGAFNPSVSSEEETLWYNEYDAKGYNVASMTLRPDQWSPVKETRDFSFRLYEKLLGEESPIQFDSTRSKEFQVKSYPKWKHLFNIHSWSPLALNSESYSLRPSVTILSQNNLSTAFTNLSYEYNMNEASGAVKGSFIYKGLYPQLTLAGEINNRRGRIRTGSEARWQEQAGTFGAAVPLNYTRGIYYRYVVPAIQYSYIAVRDLPGGEVDIADMNVHSVYYSLNLSRNRKRALLDLQPRWGQYVQVGFRYAPWGKFRYNDQFYSRAGVYLPGIAKNHGVGISAAFQHNYANGSFDYTNLIAYPRGYSRLYDRQMAVFKLNYTLPLCYPDVNIPGFIYVKRVYASLFTDMGMGDSPDKELEYYPSLGLELLNDFHVFSNIVPFIGGFRLNFLPKRPDVNVQFIINLGF